jgi:peptide/nickel transport system substrate-binding protein
LEAYPYDPEAGMALLDDAGWVDSNGDGVRDKDGVELVLVHGTTSVRSARIPRPLPSRTWQNAASSWILLSYSADVYFQSYGGGGPLPTGELDIGQFSSTEAFPDPDTSRWLCSEIPTDEYPDGINDQKICDPELDELFRLQSTQIDFEERQQTLWRIGEIMYENVYWLGVWQDLDTWAVSARLTKCQYFWCLHSTVLLNGILPNNLFKFLEAG